MIELAHQLVQTRDVTRDVPGTQLNWTRAQVDGPGNHIPERATATADVRLTARDGAERLQAALQKKMQAGSLVPDTKTTVTMDVGRPAFVANDAGRALAKRAQAIYADLDSIEPRLYLMTRLLTTL